MDIDKNFLDFAIVKAEKSFSLGNYPVGAVLVFDDDIVGTSGNFGETDLDRLLR